MTSTKWCAKRDGADAKSLRWSSATAHGRALIERPRLNTVDWPLGQLAGRNIYSPSVIAMSQPENFDLRSHDAVDSKRDELLHLFPEIRTEGGKLDFERLKLALGESVDVGKERYGMSWPGKADCFRTIQQASLATLRPCPDESVDFERTDNLIIEGDNLEVLKLLQKSYLGQVGVVYIDPPYNTGTDFIYPDNYSESLQTYLEYTGQLDAEGRKFGTNTEADGRFHSKWLNMIYPRLYLARNLLSEHGLIFISIDNNEFHNLRRICDEVFGEESFVGVLTWITTTQPDNIGRARFGLQTDTEYVFVYSRCARIELPPFALKHSGEAPSYPHVGKFGACRFEIIERAAEGAYARPTLQNFSILGQLPRAGKQWQIGEETARDLETRGKVEIVDGIVKRAVYPEDESAETVGLIPFWSHLEHVSTSQKGKAELTETLGAPHGFDTVKPVNLLTEILSHLPPDTLVLDFFAGSGTTAAAALEMNRDDGGSRRFILVQLPEPLDRDNPKQRTLADYLSSIGRPPKLAELTKERVRRVVKKLHAATDGVLALGGERQQDLGFRVFKLAESNFTAWRADAPTDAVELAKQLELHVDHVRPDRTDNDLLCEILLKSGFPLTTPIEVVALANKTTYRIASGALVICLERAITLELIRAIATKPPERVVCLDAGFAGNDQLKTNAVQIFKGAGVKSFKTV